MNGLAEPLIREAEGPTRYDRQGICWLFLTIVCEIAGTVLLKRGMDDVRIFVSAYILYFVGLSLFTLALRSIPLSIAYSTWCAIGIVGVTISSKILYAEEISASRWFCILGTIPLVIGMYVM